MARGKYAAKWQIIAVFKVFCAKATLTAPVPDALLGIHSRAGKVLILAAMGAHRFVRRVR